MPDDAVRPPEEASTRRSFLDAAVKAGLATCSAAMGVPAALYLLPARARGPKDLLVSAGPASAFVAGTARLIQAEGRPILVVATDRIRAFSAICTHLGCIVKWDAATSKIICPCHAGIFGPDGKVLSGPPPRDLPEYTVIRTENEVKVKL